MKNSKSILYLFTALTIVLSSAIGVETTFASGCASGNYVISAYYSPVPGQTRYVTGSYDGDIRLNGGGVTTASGTKVADAPSSFVAAPPCIAFGTVVNIDNLGSHTVLDRGGSIKGNRLDIWMGYGDVGLQNALSWGKRTVFVSIDGSTAPVFTNTNFAFNTGKASLKPYQVIKTNTPYDFMRELAFGDSGEDVARLQQILKDNGYYKSSVNGVYDNSTKLAVEQFNAGNGKISRGKIDSPGRFGSDSAVYLNEVLAYNREKYFEAPNRSLGRGSRGDDVKKLQEFLMSLGFLENVTGVYDSATVNAVMAFQIAEGVISNATDQGAGYFGPMTQLAFDKLAFSLDDHIFAKKTEISSEDDILLSSLEFSEMITDSLTLGSSGEQVVRLQQLLKDLNFLRIDPTGYYGPVTANAVYQFQLRYGILDSRDNKSAGFVGPETRNALNIYLNRRNEFIANLIDKDSVELASVLKEISLPKFNRDLVLGDTGEDVRNLQEFLKVHGYFSGTVLTDFFGPVTKSALVKFKIDKGVSNIDSNPIFDSVVRNLINGMI